MKPAVGGIPFMMAYAVSNNEKKVLDQLLVTTGSEMGV